MPIIKTVIDQYAWKESETVTETREIVNTFNVSNLRASIDQLKADMTKRLAENIISQQSITSLENKIAEGKLLGIL